MLINLFKIIEPVHVYYLCLFICEIIGLVVVSSNTKGVVVTVSSAYHLIISAQVYHIALC